jgi:hypothetical protein
MGTRGEKRKTYRAAKDPLDGSFLNGAFYRCHLELQYPGLRDQEDSKWKIVRRVTLSSHMIAYVSSSTRRSRDDMSKDVDLVYEWHQQSV